MATTGTDTPKVHLSLNVTNLARAVAFYRVLFDVEPAKRHDDYAKFELEAPPVVFSLVPHPPSAGDSLSHLTLRVPDQETLDQIRRRVDQAEQNCDDAPRFWIADPDGNSWKVVVGNEDDMASPPALPRSDAVAEAGPSPAEPIVWEHFVTNALPERIPHDDDTVDEVRLTGTFNAPLSEAQRVFMVMEARRVLRPGGKVVVHGLMADRPFPGAAPALPGLAALVSRVPVHTEPLHALAAAGFAGVQIVKFGERAWFQYDGVELREVKLTGWKLAATGGETCQVVYRGPFREAVDDAGRTYPRGQTVSVPRATWEQLRRGPAAGQFVFVEPDAGGSSACGE